MKLRFKIDEHVAIHEILKVINLIPYKHKLCSSLSTGERKKLMLGIALIGNPKVLILDEPTTGMDPSAR